MENETVSVRFVDVRTGKDFATAHMPPSNLPQTFALNTTLTIDDAEWQVVKAEPVTAQEFVKQGHLTLTLFKVETMPIDKIFYTLPTLCNRVPPLIEGSTQQDKRVFEIHADNWRQIEFISRSYADTIPAEMQQIERIIRETGKDEGPFWSYRECHIREQPDPPITTKLPLDHLYTFFPSTINHYPDIAYSNEVGLISGGFAFSIGDIVVYGQQESGFVRDLGIRHTEGKADSAVGPSFERLMNTYDLYLVAWVQLAVFTDTTVKDFLAITN